jgi:hypothetical protein
MSLSGIGRLVVFVAVGVIAGCSQTTAPRLLEPEVKPAPPTPIAEEKEELGKPSWNPEWDLMVEKALPPEMLSPRVAPAIKPFCPRFNVLSDADKRAYWAYLFQALAGAEAGLVPTTDVRHAEPEVAVKDTVTKRMVRSEGLLQLTYMDADRYGCDFDWVKDKELPEKNPSKTILQPANNLICGVKIMKSQLIERRQPLLSRSSYWSTLRPGTVSFQVFMRQMANLPEVCRMPRPAVRSKRGAGHSMSLKDGTSPAASK